MAHGVMLTIMPPKEFTLCTPYDFHEHSAMMFTVPLLKGV